jgi:cholesterol 24(S)-hydroxylase
MELDTVNKPNNKFNSNVFHAFSCCKEYHLDPMIKFKPNKWNHIRKHRESIRYLRETGRQQLQKRLEMIKNGEELPNDILTNILKSHGELIYLFKFKLFI